jgi:hypothetical protein
MGFTLGRDPDADDPGLADPMPGDTVTIGSVAWYVDQVSEQSANHSRLLLTRRLQRERAQPGFRRH